MKAETADYLAKARQHLEKADFQLARYPDEAGRSAYLAGLNAACGFIYERTGRVMKRHAGVHGEFHKLVKGDAAFTDEARAFLGRSYRLKEIADYLTGASANVTPELASETIAMARRFVTAIVAVLPPSPAPSNPKSPQP